MTEPTDPREAAIRRIKLKRAFRTHAFTYVAVNVLLTVIWLFAGGGFYWPIFTVVFWGFGLAMHAWATFGERPITEADIQREIERGGEA